MRADLIAFSALVASSANANLIVQRRFIESLSRANLANNLAERPASVSSGRVNCVDGQVTTPENGEVYNCSNVDFLSFISSEDLMIAGKQYLYQSSDVWGWLEPETDREITILTLDTGIVMIDSTVAVEPCILAKYRSRRPPSPWGDVKVVGNYAYAIKDKLGGVETAPAVGMEVYDLRKLAALDCTVEAYEIPTLEPDYTTHDHGSCHNVISNTETGRVYSCGCRDTCDGGLVIYDVTENPLIPNQIGCVSEDGYTHDAQCVLYTGPDDRYSGHEICIAFNEDTLTIWDLTDALEPVLVSRTFYENQVFTHQGWFNYDMSKILLDDELDEQCNEVFEPFCADLANDANTMNGITRTTTYVWDATDLENPSVEFNYVHTDTSIDHNLYVWGAIHERGWGGNSPRPKIPNPALAYLNNYMAGLRILNIGSNTPADWTEVGFFDITDTTENAFLGCWSGYMHPSGVYALSSIEKGIFFLDPNVEFVDAQNVFVTSFPTPVPTPEAEESEEDGDGGASPVLYVMFFLFLAGTLTVGYLMGKGSKKAAPKANGEGEVAMSVADELEGDVKQASV